MAAGPLNELMAYRWVPLEGVETRWSEGPLVTVVTRGEARPDLVLEFVSSVMGPDGSFRVSRLTFERVLEYHWTDPLGPLPGNDDDVEFDLIEITDSELVRRRREEEPLTHHYRMFFDHHGCYDIVCTGIHVVRHVSRGEGLCTTGPDPE